MPRPKSGAQGKADKARPTSKEWRKLEDAIHEVRFLLVGPAGDPGGLLRRVGDLEEWRRDITGQISSMSDDVSRALRGVREGQDALAAERKAYAEERKEQTGLIVQAVKDLKDLVRTKDAPAKS